MLKIGLTGGIGSGKSTVSDLFQDLSVPIIDADVIAHQLTTTDQATLKAIADAFGSQAFLADHSLDRAYLRDRIFTNPIEKQKLEAILHPRIQNEIETQVMSLASPYYILSIPLLFETNMTHLVDRILVVDCPLEDQVARVMQRSQLSEDRVRSIIANQISREQRIAQADDIIDNSGNLSQLAEQVKKLHNSYLSLSVPTGQTNP